MKRLRLTRVQWLICIVAAMGFAFDIYELLVLPLIARPALLELGGLVPGTPEFGMWVGRLFYVPALAGGVFGLLGGYLTDRLGRRRVLTWSIFLYSGSAFGAGFSTSLEMLLFFRILTFVGVCVEFVAAVAWLAELFEDPKQREKVLGYTQAFSSIGGLMAAVANGLCLTYASGLPALIIPEWLPLDLGVIQDSHGAWRYTLMSGLIPALPLALIRPFLPESPSWQRKKLAGTLRRPRISELFGPELRKVTVVTTLMFACSYGAAFGALQMIPQIVPGLSDVKEQTAGKPIAEQKRIEQQAAAGMTKVQEVGGMFGRILLALLVARIVSRRRLIRLFQVPGLLVIPLVFGYAATQSTGLLYPGVFLAGLLTVGQFSFWGNYLPRVFPTHLRGTGESFAANIGGRMIGTSFAWVTSTLAVQGFVPGAGPSARLAYTAAAVGLFVYAAGLVASFWLPEPKQEALPD